MTDGQIGTAAAIATSFLTGIVIYAERAFPFLLFAKKEPPKIIAVIEKYIPPMVLAALLFYCLKDVEFSAAKGFVPHFAALTLTAALHIWKSNALLSIFSGTALYIVLGNVL